MTDTLVDTNVVVDLLARRSDWANWSQEMLERRSREGELLINPIIYAEVSVAIADMSTLDDRLARMGLTFVDVPRPALFDAAKAFAAYRRRGGTRSGVLPDFFIGAHANVLGVPLLTRDTRRFATYFPTLDLITP